MLIMGLNVNGYPLLKVFLMIVRCQIYGIAIWHSQSLYAKEWILLSVDQRLKDQFKQKWCTEINMSSKGLCYKIFKNELVFEKYLSLLSPQYIYVFSIYRCSSHRLPAETGRWYNISRNDRLCHLCDSNDIGDEIFNKPRSLTFLVQFD
jgi:hypothetical protein